MSFQFNNVHEYPFIEVQKQPNPNELIVKLVTETEVKKLTIRSESKLYLEYQDEV